MSCLSPSPRYVAPHGKSIACGEKMAARPDEGTNCVPHLSPPPQLIAMRDLVAWWERENFIARGAR
jgi:hypothetical protein